MNRFTIPRDIYYGDDALEVLKKLNGRKAIIVTGGSSMKRFGFLDKVEDYLGEELPASFIEYEEIKREFMGGLELGYLFTAIGSALTFISVYRSK